MQKLPALGLLILLVVACSAFPVHGQNSDPKGYKITKLKIQSGNVVIGWEGSNVTCQVQCRTSYTGQWQDVGSPTSGSSITTVMPGPVAFFRVVEVASAGPAVSLASPVDRSTVSGRFPITASGSGIARVEFYRDGNVLLGTATATPFTLDYDTTSLANGTHSFHCKAYDAAGNTAVSQTITVTVNNSLLAPATGQCLWQRYFGKPTLSVNGACAISGSAVDSLGNVVIAGSMQYTVDFGTGPQTGHGGQDMFIAKYSPAGVCLWSRVIGSGFNDKANGVAIDSADNILVTGVFAGSADFGSGTGLNPHRDQFGISFTSDMFVAKYDKNGQYVWAKAFGDYGSEMGQGIAVDRSNNILLIGSHANFSPGIDFGGGSLNTYGDRGDVYVAKLTSSGDYIWAKSFGGENVDIAQTIAVDSAGNVLVGGRYNSSTANFGSGQVSNSGTDYAVWVGKYAAATGNAIWVKTFRNDRAQSIYGLAVDSNDNVVFAGDFQGSMNLEQAGGPVLSAASGGSLYMVKFSPAGDYLWNYINGADQGGPHVTGLAVDKNNNFILIGNLNTGLNFGFEWLLGLGGPDGFVAKFSPGGNCLWAKRGGPYNDNSAAIAVDRNANIFLAGGCAGSQDLGCDSVTLLQTPGVSVPNNFLIKIAP